MSVPGCDNHATGDEPEQKETSRSENKTACSNDVTEDDEMQATAVPGCNSEETVNGHSTVGELEPEEEVRHNESCYNVVTEESEITGNCVKRTNSASDQSASSPEGKLSNAETQGACQGAAASDKIVPDYPLFPLSRGFCLSLKRALDSFHAALEKAQLPDCRE